MKAETSAEDDFYDFRLDDGGGGGSNHRGGRGHTGRDPAAAFRPIFAAAADRAASSRSHGSTGDGSLPSSLSSSASERAFLSRLRLVTPELRRQACSVPSVQSVLFRTVLVGSSLGCIAVIIQGAVLVSALAVLRLALDGLAAGEGRIPGVVDRRATALLGLSAYLALAELVRCGACVRQSVFASQVLRSFWSWINLCSSGLLLAAAALLVSRNGTAWSQRGVDAALRVGAAASGMMWLRIAGHLAQWWYDMGRFMDLVIRVSRLLCCPLVFLGILVTAFAQMSHSIDNTSDGSGLCSSSDMAGSPQPAGSCSSWEYYWAAYLLLLGINPVGDTAGGDGGEDDERASAGILILVVLFTLMVILLFLAALLLVIFDSKRPGADCGALDSYWLRMLSFYFLTSSVTSCFGHVEELGSSKKRSKKGDLDAKSSPWRFGVHVGAASFALERWWRLLTSSYTSNSMKKTDLWYVRGVQRKIWSKALSNKWILRLSGLVILPAWLLLGLVTLGLLWPPQVKKWIFQPSQKWAEQFPLTQGGGEVDDEVSSLRNEVVHIKSMMYEQSMDLQLEIRDLQDKVSAL